MPGATIPGERYLPLMEAVQAHYPGGLWVAATTEWPNDSPNPVVIGDQMAECLTAAADTGLNTQNVFFAGHSLGGVVLESWVRTGSNADLTKGIALLGTWLPNLLGRSSDVRSNEYPVPVLTAIGELDGGGLSYLIREVRETQALPTSVTAFSKTIYVPQVEQKANKVEMRQDFVIRLIMHKWPRERLTRELSTMTLTPRSPRPRLMRTTLSGWLTGSV